MNDQLMKILWTNPLLQTSFEYNNGYLIIIVL